MKLSDDLKVLNMPEMFYDVLAYTTPSALFLIGFVLINGINIKDFISDIMVLNSFIYEALIVLLIIGLLYYMGQVCTTISYILIANPYIYLSKKFKKNIDTEEFYINRLLTIKMKAPTNLIQEIVKRYARMVLSRNIVLYSFVLFINSLFISKYHLSVFLFILFLLSAIDSLSRLQDVARETRKVMKMIKKYA